MIELRNVYKVFNPGTIDERIALNHINLKINDGEFVTIIGGNGSGKTTTMNILAGSLKPDEGQVLLNGVDITKEKDYQRAKYFGRVFQDPRSGTASQMQIEENMAIAFRRGKHRGFKWEITQKEREIYKELIQNFDLGLEDRFTTKIGVLSGGQRQAITLLLATLRPVPSFKDMRSMYVRFSGKPQSEAAEEIDGFYNDQKAICKSKISEIKSLKLSRSDKKVRISEEKEKFNKILCDKYDLAKQILLLDEHTAALDPKTATKVLELTDKIVRSNNMTTVMITHNMKDAITYGDRLIMYSQGKIVLDVKGEEKRNLKVEDLYKLFDEQNLK